GHVVLSVRRSPAPPLDTEPQIRAGPDDTQLPHLPELRDPALEPGARGAPVRHRVVAVLDVARAEDEALVLLEPHACLLRVRRRRALDAAPAQLARRDPSPAVVHQLPARRDLALVPRRPATL